MSQASLLGILLHWKVQFILTTAIREERTRKRGEKVGVWWIESSASEWDRSYGVGLCESNLVGSINLGQTIDVDKSKLCNLVGTWIKRSAMEYISSIGQLNLLLFNDLILPIIMGWRNLAANSTLAFSVNSRTLLRNHMIMVMTVLILIVMAMMGWPDDDEVDGNHDQDRSHY